MTVSSVRLLQLSEYPWELLLLADPSREQIERYIHSSAVLGLFGEENIVGVAVLTPRDKGEYEITNVAIAPTEQGKGYGKWLLQEILRYAEGLEANEVTIATGNSSLLQLGLYQKAGFRLHSIEKDYFLKNYPEPIFENGLQCCDKVILRKVFSHNDNEFL